MVGVNTKDSAIASSSKAKKKKSKKKVGATKAEANGEPVARNGVKSAADNEADEIDDEVEPATVRAVPKLISATC
jgi:hypothetical protein